MLFILLHFYLFLFLNLTSYHFFMEVAEYEKYHQEREAVEVPR